MHLFITECIGKRNLPILTFSDFYENFCERLRLLQITQFTYKDYSDRGLFPANDVWNINWGNEWNEGKLSNPARNIVAGLFVLQRKPGGNLSEKLANYYGKNPAANRNYADKILKGAERLTEFLNGRNLYDLTPEECDKIKSELDKIVH
jgi:hypothetical protein